MSGSIGRPLAELEMDAGADDLDGVGDSTGEAAHAATEAREPIGKTLLRIRPVD